MIAPEILAVANYQTVRALGFVDTLFGVALPYLTSAFGIFLLRQAFLGVPKDLEEAARIEGCGTLGVLWRVYVPLARPIYLAYGLVQVSFHWNNFLWPLIITNSVETRPSDGRPLGVLLGRSRHRLVGDHGRDHHDLGPAAHRLPVVPAPIRAELHAGRDQVTRPA